MKFKNIILILLFIFSLSSCGKEDPNFIIHDITNKVTKIEEEVEVSQITSSITEVYNKVSKGCIGIYCKNETTYSTGSGVVFKEDNGLYYAVTNEHVVDEAVLVKAYFDNGIYVDATIIGKDSKNDIAVISFSLDSFPSLKESIYINQINSNILLSIGQTALAIGCPLDLVEHYNNLTSGIISNISSLNISIDTPVNSGNSGGGLFNLNGELIGLVYKKDTYSTGTTQVPVDCMGYAIPLEIVNKSINDILTLKRDITRPLIGISVTTVNTLLQNTNYEKYSQYLPTIENKYNYIIITGVTEDSVADTIGLKPSDIVLEIGGNPVNNLDDISYKLNLMLLSDSTTIKIYRKSIDNIITFLLKFI